MQYADARSAPFGDRPGSARPDRAPRGVRAGSLSAFVARETIVALALVGPQKAVALFEQLPDGPSGSLLHQTKDRARWALAAVLARPADRRWMYLEWHYFHAWVPDAEDLAESF